MLTDDIDNHSTNISFREVVNVPQGAQIVEARSRRHRRISCADQIDRPVSRDLTCDQQLVAKEVGVSITRRRSQTSIVLLLIHGPEVSDRTQARREYVAPHRGRDVARARSGLGGYGARVMCVAA